MRERKRENERETERENEREKERERKRERGSTSGRPTSGERELKCNWFLREIKRDRE